MFYLIVTKTLLPLICSRKREKDDDEIEGKEVKSQVTCKSLDKSFTLSSDSFFSWIKSKNNVNKRLFNKHEQGQRNMNQKVRGRDDCKDTSLLKLFIGF